MTPSPSERYVMGREERKRKYGFDCPDEMLWKGWAPGGDYTQKIILKNVSKVTQTLKYVLPDTKFFFLKFPETITLSAGMQAVVDVSFRPIREEEYDDLIEFQTQRGSFFVRVRAVLPRMDMEMDNALDFGLCQVHETSVRRMNIRNIGEKVFSFSFSSKIEGCLDFDVSPKAGTVQPGQTQEITISLLPKEAAVLVRDFYVSFNSKGGDSTVRAFKVSAISKYPFLRASVNRIDFGEVLPFETKEYMFSVRNHALVPASFRIKAISKAGVTAPGIDTVFRFEPAEGVIPADSVMTLKAFYTPTSSQTYSCASFVMQTPPFSNDISLSPSVVQLTLCGTSFAPKVTLEPNCLSFGDVALNERKVKVVHLSNASAVPVAWTIAADDESAVFGAVPSTGVIAPNSQVSVSISFLPSAPINYYRRVFVSFDSAAEPLYVDVIGTSYDPDNRPLPLLPKHVKAFRSRGYTHSMVTPQELEGVSGPKDTPVLLNEPLVSPVDELFQLCPNAVDVELESGSKDYLSFGSVSRFSAVKPSRSITLRSNAQSKMTVAWLCPLDKRSGRPVFEVSPATADLPPGGTVSFRVYFRPEYDTQYFCHNLEAYVYWKVNRSFRLVTDKTLIPPFVVRVPAIGDTFDGTSERVPPSVSFRPRNEIAFAPVSKVPHAASIEPHEAVLFRRMHTVVLENHASTPCLFECNVSVNRTEFRCFPAAGMIPAQSRVTVALLFTPTADSFGKDDGEIHKGELQVTLSASTTRFIKLLGIVSPPRTELEMTSLVFPPTFVGAFTTRSIRLHNLSCMESSVVCKIPSELRSVLSVVPERNFLKGRDSCSVEFKFSPQIADMLTEGVVHVNSQALAVRAQSSLGAVSLDNGTLDFGVVRLGSKAKRVLTLLNHADCAMAFSFEVEFCGEPDFRGRPTGIFFSESAGSIPARSSKPLTVLFRPSYRGRHDIVFRCKVGRASSSGEVSPSASVGAMELVGTAQGEGDHPYLQITDVASSQIPSLQKAASAVSLVKLNHALRSDVRTSEWVVDKTLPIHALEFLDSFTVDFGAAAVNSLPHSLSLMLTNVSKLPADFAIRLPTDSDIDVEQWADKDEPSERDILYHELLDSGVLSINPRSAMLQPGESVRIDFRYAFTLAPRKPNEVHELPIVISLHKGRSLMLKLRGRTLLPLQRVLDVSPVHRLAPVPIGERQPPVQYVPIDNCADEVVGFKIDYDTDKAEQFGFAAFRVLDTEGSIEPRGRTYVRVVFHPLEVKPYDFPAVVLLTGVDGDDRIIDEFSFTVRGRGIHPRDAPSSVLAEFFDADELPPSQKIVTDSFPLVFDSRLASNVQIPCFGSRRILYAVENRHATDAFSVTTVPSSMDAISRGDEVFYVDPVVLTIGPGEKKSFAVEVAAGSIPQIGTWDIPLEIENETLKAAVLLRERAEMEKEENDDNNTESSPKKRRPRKRKSVVDALTMSLKLRRAQQGLPTSGQTSTPSRAASVQFGAGGDQATKSDASSASGSLSAASLRRSESMGTARTGSVVESMIDEIMTGADEDNPDDSSPVRQGRAACTLTLQLHIHRAQRLEHLPAENDNAPLVSTIEPEELSFVENIMSDILGDLMVDGEFRETMDAKALLEAGNARAGIAYYESLRQLPDLPRASTLEAQSDEAVESMDAATREHHVEWSMARAVLTEALSDVLADAVEGLIDLNQVPRRIRLSSS